MAADQEKTLELFTNLDRKAIEAKLAQVRRDAQSANLKELADLFHGVEGMPRALIEQKVKNALAWLAERAYQEEDFSTALELALRLLACDPCREDAHRVVMRAHVRRGERAQALRQYRLCEHALLREFEIEPEALTTELFERIRRDPASV